MTNRYIAISASADVPDPVGEPGAGQPRSPGHVHPAAGRAQLQVVAGLKAEVWPLAPGPDQLRVVLVHSVSGGGIGQVRDLGQQRVPLACRFRLCVSGGLHFGCELAQFGKLVRAGRAALGPAGQSLLRRAQDLRALGLLAPLGVCCQQRIEILRCAAPGQRRPVAVRFLPRGLEIDHPSESSGALAASRSRFGAGRVASTEPPRMSANAPAMAGVNCSPRTVTPSTTATAGLI